MPHLAARLSSGHFNKAFRTVQANGLVAQVAKGCQVTARTAAEVEDGIRAVSRYMIEQGGPVLTDVVVLRTVPERFCKPVIESEGRTERSA